MSITSRRKRQSASLPRSPRLLTGVPLGWALTVPFVLLTVGATTLVGYLSYRNGEQTVTELASQLMQEKGDQTVLYLERSLAVPHLINQLNADSIRLGQLPGFETTNPEPLEKFFWGQLRRFPDVTTIAMASDRGGMVGSGRRLPIGSDSLSVYRTAEFAKGKYTLSVADADGKIVETKTISENYDARTRPWYQAPAKAGKATWSPIYQFIGEAPVLGISAGLPVYTDSGELRGILAADIDLKSLSHFLANLNVSPSGQIFIVERSGLLVANSTNQSIIGMQAGEAERINAGESEDSTMRETMAQLNARSQDLSQIDGIQQFTIQQFTVQQSRIGQSSAKWVRVIPFQDQYGLDWLIVMVVPESDFMQAIHANQATTLLLCLLTLGGAIGLGIFATNRLTGHFSQLNRVSQELAAGNLDRRLLTNGSIVELDGLAHTFNRMADQIQDSFDRIKTALAESKEKFTTIFRTSPEAVAIASMAEGRMLEVNDSFLQFFGYSQDEVVGKTALELQMWHNLAQRDQYRTLLEQEGSVRNLEAQVCTRSDEIKTVLLSAEVRTLEGQDCIIVTHRDITHLKQAEAALRQSEERNRAILTAMPDLVTVIGADGIYRDIVRSSSLVDLIPLDVNPIGKHLTEFVSAEVAAIKLQLIQRTLAMGEMQILEQRIWLNERWQYEEVRAVPYGSDAVLMMVRDISDRKQAEIALQQSENRFQRIATASPAQIYILVCDSNGSNLRFEYISSGIREIQELEPEQVLQDATLTYAQVHPDDRALYDEATYRTFKTLEPFFHEWRIITPSGKLKWVQANSRPDRRDNGDIAWYGVLLDVTERKRVEDERKRAEIALQESEARFQEIAQTISQVFYVLSVSTGEYLYISPAYEKLWGYSCESLYQDPESWLKRVHPEDLEQVVQMTNQFSSGSPQRHQYRIFSPNGEIRWIESESLIVQGEDSNPLRVVGLAEDITDRKRAEAALLDSEIRFRRAFSDAPIGMALIGLDDRWIQVNPMLCDMLDFTEPELLSRTASSLVHPEDLNKLPQCVQQVLSSENRNAQIELRFCRQQGQVIWGLISLSLVRDGQGKPLYYVAQIQDITERHAIDRMKNEFISIVSHELRTPLTAIRGFLGLLDTGIYDKKPEKAKHMIGQALTNSDRLVRLVNDILDLERLSSGKIQLIKEACGAEELMQRAAAGVQSLADPARIQLVIVPTTAQAWADPDCIIQTLTNLLSNAIKFSPPDAAITLSAQTRTDSVLFSVQDQGRGIPADKLETIFGRFQQVDVSDSRQKGGTGLGLAICQSIVQQHGGSIWAESIFGNGSTFYFTLPLMPEGER